jgi:predicted RNA-binding Zn ribbon-like protein
MESRFLFIGEHRALDFLNTEKRDGNGNRVELLTEPTHLAEWFAESGLPPLTPNATPIADAHALRNAIRALVIAWKKDDAPPPDALAHLNHILATGAARTLLSNDYTPMVETIASTVHPLLPIAQSALDLLTQHDRNLVRQCSGSGCVLWFLDTTKNKRRRWCRMEACGNREKAAAHYRRHKETST